jgi:hypothetical protein
VKKIFWCRGRDLNPHGVIHTALNRARLPVPPTRHIDMDSNFSIIKAKNQAVKTLKVSFPGKGNKKEFVEYVVRRLLKGENLENAREVG